MRTIKYRLVIDHNMAYNYVCVPTLNMILFFGQIITIGIYNARLYNNKKILNLHHQTQYAHII